MAFPVKISALPPSMALLRPRALRFRLLNIPGVVIRHARQTLLRLAEGHPVLMCYGKHGKARAAAYEVALGETKELKELIVVRDIPSGLLVT
ncbi:MAG: hypothetical protein FJ125_13870 [Deltaproteobacteria bacterium]|nr:hypothetical protein [Deltaproteobacteria bacterium]